MRRLPLLVTFCSMLTPLVRSAPLELPVIKSFTSPVSTDAQTNMRISMAYVPVLIAKESVLADTSGNDRLTTSLSGLPVVDSVSVPQIPSIKLDDLGGGGVDIPEPNASILLFFALLLIIHLNRRSSRQSYLR